MVDINTAQTLAPPAYDPAMSPEGIALRQAYAKALLEHGMGPQEIHSPTQGVAQMTQALVGGLMARKASEQQYGLRQQAIQQYIQALQGGQGQGGPVGTPMGGAGAVTAGGGSGGPVGAPAGPSNRIPAGGSAGGSIYDGGGGLNAAGMGAVMNPFLPDNMRELALARAGMGPLTDAQRNKIAMDNDPAFRAQQQLPMVTDLRKEVTGSDTYKNLQSIIPTYRTMVKTAANNNTSNDMNLAVAYGQIINPGSVTKAGQAIQLTDPQNIPEWFKNAIAQFNTSSHFTNEQKMQMIAEAKARVDQTMQQFGSETAQYHDIAQRHGLNLGDIVPDVGEIPEPPNLTPPPAAGAPTAVPPVPPGVDPDTWKHGTPELWKAFGPTPPLQPQTSIDAVAIAPSPQGPAIISRPPMPGSSAAYINSPMRATPPGQ